MLGYYIQDLLGLLDKDTVVVKDDLFQNLANYQTYLQNYKDILSTALQVIDDTNKINFNDLLPIFKKFDLNPKNNKEIIKDLYLGYTYLINIITEFKQVINDSFDSYTARDAMNARQVALLEYGENIFIAADGLELLSSLVLEKVTNNEPIYKKRPKFTLEYVLANADVFKMLFNNKLYEELKRIKKLPTVPAENNRLRILLPKRNFTGKLFYSITSWWFLRRAEVIERKKATKHLLELRVAELKEQLRGQEPSLAIKKEIEYYESVIAELDKDIHEFYTED